MSNFREKAREIKKAGEEERGNFEPTGAPLRLYKYWLDNSSSNKAKAIKRGSRRENFCHFWRVVAIWAPLMFLGINLAKVIDTLAFKIVATVVVLGALAWALSVTGSWLMLGVVTGIILGVAAIIVGGVYLHERFWQSRWNKTAEKVAGITLGVLAVGVVLFGYGALIVEFGWVVLAWTVAIIGLIVAVFYVGSKVSEFISGRRKIKRDAQAAADLEWIQNGGTPPWETAKPKAPSAFSKILSGLADFLILATQVVRVKKWKICPMVDIQQ